jgi:hypothetical protein
MNLKRIIREEIDDFDWIRDITPITQIGTKYRTPSGNIVTITGYNNSRLDTDVVELDVFDISTNLIHKSGVGVHFFTRLVNDGDWVRVTEPLTESDGDGLDWIRDVEPIDLDRDVKSYVDQGYVVALWLGPINNELKNYVENFIETSGFDWWSNSMIRSWDSGKVQGITFYPNKLMGLFRGGDAREDWVEFHSDVEHGLYDDISPDKFHSIDLINYGY